MGKFINKREMELVLFEEIDNEITKRNVDYLLKRYHNIRRLAGSTTPKITSTYSIVPRSFTGQTSDSTSKTVDLKVQAQKQLKEIEDALRCLSGDAKKRLYFKYISDDSLYDYEIYEKLNLSKTTYYKELGEAQLEFAEAYRKGELLAFEIE